MNQLKAGAILNYVIILLNTLVGLLYTPYMLRMMGQSEYGLYALVSSVIAYLTILDLGLGNAIVRYTAKYRAEGKLEEQYKLFGMFLKLYLIIGAIILISGVFLYINVDNMFGKTMTSVELDHARIMMLILVFNLAFTFPMSIFGSIITAYERFVFPKVVNIIRIVLNTLIMIALLHLGYKAIAMVVLHTVFNVTTLLLNYWYCKRNLRVRIINEKINFSLLKEISIYSFWIFLGVIMDRIYWSTGQFVLGAVSGTTAIAIYAIAIQLHGLYGQFSSAISTVFLPKVTGMVALNSSYKEISDLFIKTGRIQNIAMVLILSGFIVFGKPFILLWAGQEYTESYLITVLLFVSLYVPLIQNLGITILQARNQMKFRSLLYIVIAFVALGLQIVFSKLWGGLGCAIAVSGALLIGQGIIMNIYYQKKQYIDIVKFWKEILKMDIVPFFIVGISIYILSIYAISTWGELLLDMLVFMLLYLPLFYKISMSKSEKELILGPIKKFK